MTRRWCVTSMLFCVTAACALAQDAAPLPPERTVALRTTAGYYVTAENGGGSSVQTDRMELGPWETFALVPVGPGIFAFRSDNGSYLCDLSATQRGVRGARTSLGASRKQIDASPHFKVMLLNAEGPVVAIMTPAGKYLTAESNGGVKARASRAISTDRTEIGAWEHFQLVDVARK